MTRVLQIKPHLRIYRAGPGQVLLIGEHERYLLRGRLYEILTPLLDGQRTEEEIIAGLAGEASPSEIEGALSSLVARGYAVEANAAIAPEIAAFWHTLGVDAARAAEALAATPVSVEAASRDEAALAREALRAAGVREEAGAPLRIVVVGDYLDSELAEVNRRALAERLSWMPVKPAGSTPWFGPIFRPGEGACWECLAHRLRMNRPAESFVARHGGQSEAITGPRASLPATARTALDLAAVALARWIAGGRRGAIDGALFTLDVALLRIESHAVSQRPQCPACGRPDLLAARAAGPVALEPRPIGSSDDGGHRFMAPEEMLARYERLVSPITGVVASLGPAPERDHPLRPVHVGVYFVCPAEERPPFDAFSRVSLGKGRSIAQARASALAEAIERRSASYQGDEPRVRARLSGLDHEGVHPHDLLNFSASQYERRAEINPRVGDPRRAVPPPFDERITIDWVPAWSLTRERRRYLPASYCLFDLPIAPEERFCVANPNGHAAGTCLEEAILQAFLELAERDAVAIWWWSRVRRPAVDLASFEDPYFDALLDHYESMGQRLWVLDITNDLDLPAFVALARDRGHGRFRVGFGCHLEARLGVQRALTELNQLFDPSGRAPPPWDPRLAGDPAFLIPEEDAPRRRQSDFVWARQGDLRDDVRACVDRAAGLGLETLVIDHSRPDFGLSAVQVVVPGLRHFWPRFGPGRLYDVPVRLGWLPGPLDEADLNPASLDT